jgi:tetratricopeptide (TPR) repeat protein
MTSDTDDWERRVAALWEAFDELSEPGFRARMEALAAERPDDDPRAAYERGSAEDSTGHPGRAVAHYRRALELGLSGRLRREAVIQLASSLRNLGEAADSERLLREERDAGSDELDDAVDAFRALALVDLGREREAVALALTALAGHMTRYGRSLRAYAAEVAGG